MAAFTIGALAVAARRANAVGAVRLTCDDAGITVELVRAAGFARGFVLAALAEQVRFHAPYTAVRGLVRDGRVLHLAFDPDVVRPHNRFALTRFSTDPASVLARAFAARTIARFFAFLAPIGAATAAVVFAPPHLVGGVLGRASVALLAVIVTAVVARELVAWRVWGGPLSDGYRDALELEIGRRLGIAPVAVTVSAPVELAEVVAAAPRAPIGRNVFAAGAVAALVVGAIAMFDVVGRRPSERPPLLTAAFGPVAARLTTAHLTRTVWPRCLCVRADSPLWKDGVPLASFLAFARADEAMKPVVAVKERKRWGFSFDVAAVNNGSTPLREVHGKLTFSRFDKKRNRRTATDRGVFYDGGLLPGHAVKWHVRAPGKEFRMESFPAGTLEALEVAPARSDAFAELLHSPYRAVAFHGATMLAYLRDARAKQAVRTLRTNASAREVPVLDSIERAAAELFACDVRFENEEVTACVFNGGTKPVARFVVKPSLRMESEVPVHEGVAIRFPAAKEPGPIELAAGE